MPTKKTNTTSQDAGVLRRRISELSDRIAVLENNLVKTQERVQADMKTLFEQLNRR